MKDDFYSEYNRGYRNGHSKAREHISIALIIAGLIVTLTTSLIVHIKHYKNHTPAIWWVGMSLYGVSIAISLFGILVTTKNIRKINKDIKELDHGANH